MIKERLEEHHKRLKGHGISLLVPFRCLNPEDPRARNWAWLRKFWENQLPGAEVIVGEDKRYDLPFSKSVAVNDAARKATGDVFVIIDADGLIDPDIIVHCAKEIREARRCGHRLWFIPYRQFYRLSEEASCRLTNSDHKNPYRFTCPPEACDIIGDTDPLVGHWYGAMIQLLPREAFEMVGGWDPRFRGWGGEDHAAMRATDTLYWFHKTIPCQVLHVWHPQISPKGKAAFVHWKERMWEGQSGPNMNDRLSGRYFWASGHPKRMRILVDEGLRYRFRPPHNRRCHHKHFHCRPSV